jgi:hypothetical protein
MVFQGLVGFSTDIGFTGLIFYQSTSGTNIPSLYYCCKRTYTGFLEENYADEARFSQHSAVFSIIINPEGVK